MQCCDLAPKADMSFNPALVAPSGVILFSGLFVTIGQDSASWSMVTWNSIVSSNFEKDVGSQRLYDSSG